MIDLTPLEVRKKKGDFPRILRGYDPQRVDDFLDLAADRLEELVRENAALRERLSGLNESVEAFRERERAMNDALVSAQQLREDIRSQAARDAEIALREARAEAEVMLAEARAEAERIATEARSAAAAAAESMRQIQARRVWFLRSFRGYVERQLSEIEQEEVHLREQLREDRDFASEGTQTMPEIERGVPLGTTAGTISQAEGESHSSWLHAVDAEGEEE